MGAVLEIEIPEEAPVSEINLEPGFRGVEGVLLRYEEINICNKDDRSTLCCDALSGTESMIGVAAKSE